MKYASAPPDKQVGDYLWNHQALLGSGAFGKVYVGKKIGSEELFAIKMVSNSSLSDPYLKKALDNEINIMKMMKGPNVVKMHEVLMTKNNTYIIQELCEGGDLRSILNSRGKINEDEARLIFHDILSGMKMMVDNNIVHRDLKPENILVGKGTYKVGDYGFARLVNNFGANLLNTTIGTPLYMSPQILSSEEYTTKSDIWSLGVIYFEILYNKTPWHAQTQFELVKNVRKFPLQFPCHVNVTEDSRSFIKGCLQVEEKHRFTWSQVFSHPIYVKFAEKIKPQPLAPSFDNTSKKVLIDMQQVIRNFEVNVDQLFKKFDSDKGGSLNIAEFTNLVKVIDKNISTVNAEKVFTQFDQNNDGSITIAEFRKLLLETDYKEDSEENCLLAEHKANTVLKRLTDIIIDNMLDLKKIFSKFDKSGDRSLNQAELLQLLKIIDETLTDKDVRYIFKKFDADGDGNISIDEFYKFFKQEKEVVRPNLVKKGSSDHVPPGASPLIQKMMKDLKQIISVNQIDLRLVFRNFDTSRDNKLSLQEFSKLIKVINSRYLDSDIQELFRTFDTDGDKTISYDEFSKYLV